MVKKGFIKDLIKFGKLIIMLPFIPVALVIILLFSLGSTNTKYQEDLDEQIPK